MSQGDNDFLGRWSRRKAEARDGGLRKREGVAEEPVHKPGRMRTEPLPPKPKPGELADAEAPANDALLQEAALREDTGEDQVPETVEERPAGDADTGRAEETTPEDLQNIDFDGLDYDSDYTRFMGKSVPEAVRKRALRMLWGSNPILANIDGLNDYDEDFTDAALAVKGLLKTAYNAKTGYLTEEERLASYSEEARTIGSDAPKDDDEIDVAEAQDDGEGKADTSAEDAPGDEQDGNEVQTAEGDGPGEGDDQIDGDDFAEQNDQNDDDDVGEGDGDEIA